MKYEWIVGRNPVYEVLRANRRRAYRLYLAEGVRQSDRISEILSLCNVRGIPTQSAPKHQLNEVGQGHQGVALEVDGYPYSTLQDMQSLAEKRDEPPFILILDALQDPQNLGTLLRTAEGVGVHGVLFPLRQTATITPAVVSASSGASEYLLVSQINIAQAISKLKDAGLWVVGLEKSPDGQAPGELRLDGAIALVVGSEGTGMRSLVRSSCDLLMGLPMRGRIDSYNAAVAGSIALFLIWQARNFK
jgi:23S rRNA (guanosine2251-2'-O)-methyltransferase